MNEATSVLKQTNHERSTLKNSAYHKKNGSAIAKLGNKPMSDKEIEKKHGPIQTYTEGFTSYEDFKKMPPDLEADYVNNLCAKYSIRHEDISTILFELSDLDLIARLKIKGFDKKLHIIKKSEVTDEARQKFKDDVDLWRDRTEKAKIVDLSEAQRKHDIIENAEFIDYEEFSAFTIDEKVLYLNSLIDKYGVSLAAIERELFKLPVTNLRHKLDSAGVLKQIKRGNNGYNAIRANKDFCDALKNWRGESTLEETNEFVTNETKEESKSVARDILAAIIGEEPEKPAEVAVEDPKKVELPESNISDIYIPVTVEKSPDYLVEDLNAMPARDPIANVASFVEQPDISKPVAKPSSEVYFSTRYISEKGLDREAIMNKIYLLASLFANEENLEITLTVATKKEA